MNMTDPMTPWTPEDDIAMIKGGPWPCVFALPLKRRLGTSGGDYGCVTPDERSVILVTTIWDFDPFAKKIEYDSVEAMIADGWMVD